MFKQLKKQNKNDGFTLVEALVAISILMIAIASPMTLAQKSLSTATLSKDQMIASFLAQDAIEAVRSIRDEVAINGSDTDWLDNPDGTSILHSCICDNSSKICDFDAPSPTYCAIDTTSSNWQASDILSYVTNPGPLHISYDLGSKFLKYDYTGAATTKFMRYINIQKNPTNTNANEAVVRVRVSWSTPQGIQKIDVNDYIYNFSENF